MTLIDTQTGSTSASGRSLAVLTDELRATSREIEGVLARHGSALLADGQYGEDTGHDRLPGEIADFVRELDRLEGDFRRKAEETGDGLVMAAYCYEHTDSWVARFLLSAMGGE